MYNTLTDLVTDVANAIREKDNTSASIPVAVYGDRIRAIPQEGVSLPLVASSAYLDEYIPQSETIEQLSVIGCANASANVTLISE